MLQLRLNKIYYFLTIFTSMIKQYVFITCFTNSQACFVQMCSLILVKQQQNKSLLEFIIDKLIENIY